MPTFMCSVLVLQSVFSFLTISTNAHMEMSWPYPIRSQLDPAVAEADKDYSYTSPLLQDGSNFPCKGYHNGVDSNITKAIYTAGSTYNMTIAGTVTHDGGSCQLSLSYDNGATFKVIQSMIGGCPLVPGYNFTIPSYAPASSSVLLAWSWFNLIGNREMYMDCARVEIQAPATSRVKRNAEWKRQTSMAQLPDMFACNVNNGCTTIEGENVNFPYPGNTVIYGQDSIVPTDGTGFTGSGFAGDSGPNGTFNGTTTSQPVPTTFTTFSTSSTFISLATLSSTNSDLGTLVTVTTAGLTTTSVKLFTTTVFATATVTVTPGLSARSLSDQEPLMTSRTTVFSDFTIMPIPASSSSTSDQCPEMTSAAPSLLSSTFSTIFAPPPSELSSYSSPFPPSSAEAAPTALPTICIPGTFYCNTLSSFSTCVSFTYSANGNNFVYMGDVAAGMQCVNGPNGAQIIRQNDGPCTPNGQIFCKGANAFYICDEGGLIDMGPAAPGTECGSGQITRRRQPIEID